MKQENAIRNSLILLVGDWLALGLFVVLGQMDHELLSVPRLARQTALLAVPWTVVVLALGAWRIRAGESLIAFLGRSLLAWLVAAPLALLARALLQGQATIIVAFMMVTMGLGGIFLLLWRAAYFLLSRRAVRRA